MQVTHPYDISQVGMIPRPESSNPYFPASRPYQEISFNPPNPYGEFGVNNKKLQKQLLKAELNPEYDPRWGPVATKGFQIDPTPFKMKAREEKQKAKMQRKQGKYKPMFQNEMGNGIDQPDNGDMPESNGR